MMAFAQIIAIVTLLLAHVTTISASPLLEVRDACNADSCARHVTGIDAQPARTQRASDCASFLATTFVPSPSIVTITSTLVSGLISPSSAAGSNLVITAYTVAGTFVPPYVDLCGSGPAMSSRYSSACACFPGIRRATITAARPTVTTASYIFDPSFASIAPSEKSHDRDYFSDSDKQSRLQKVINDKDLTR